MNRLGRVSMRNKRAQAFSLILVLMTLFMCGSSIYIYNIQQGNAESSLVSPLVVLQIRDDLEVFEMEEKALIEKSLGEVEVDFANDGFPEKFKEQFIDGLDGEMKNFILSDLTWNGVVMDSSEFDEGSFFRSVLYSKVERDSEGLKFVRSKIGKSISLSAKDVIKVNFPVDFKFEFEREYLINKKDGKFEVNVV